MAVVAREDYYLYISGLAIENIVRSTVETFPNEMNGGLFGSNRSTIWTVQNACPLTTAKGTPNFVYLSSSAADKRLRRINTTLGQNFANSRGFVGEYHSHPILPSDSKITWDESKNLSDGDFDFIRKRMKKWGMKKWMEIVTRIETYRLRNGRSAGVTVVDKPYDFRLSLRDSKNHVYQFTFSPELVESRKEESTILGLKII